MRTTYTAAVEVATKHRLDVDELVSALADYQADLGISPRGWLEVRLTLPASTLAQACAKALSVASAATGAEAIACEVMTVSESEEREGYIPEQRAPSATHLSL